MAAVGGPVPPAVHEPATKWLAKGQTGLPWEIPLPGGLGANGGEGLSLGLSPTGKRPPRKGSLKET
jgi:hypothetical protein